MIQTKITKVWYIDGNNLENKNKYVTSLVYRDLEIAVFKEDLKDEYSQVLLWKDKDGMYWDLSLANVKFGIFERVLKNETADQDVNYCNNVYDVIKNLDLEELYKNKIKDNKYFNKCELKYISNYYPELYDEALASREAIIQENNKRRELEQMHRQEEIMKKVKETNDKFKEKLDNIKRKIASGESVENTDFSFYKDDNYDNGITEQNCFLYLAKQYGINIPLSTQGFINNRLVDIEFGDTPNYRFKQTSNKTPSTKLYLYLDQIYGKVKEELGQNKKQELNEVDNDDIAI